MTDPMTSAQRTIAERVLDEETAKREHLVVHLSGAHAYGFASPDSDLDLKAIHIDPTDRLLGFAKSGTTANRLEVIDGVEIDYTSNEVAKALTGVLAGDGNMLERVLSATPLRSIEDLEPLTALARKNLSRRFYAHYRGFARSQRKAVDEAEAPLAKKVLYVLRTALTGVHLLEQRECVPDLSALCDQYDLEIAHQLIALKREGERQPLPPDVAQRVPAIMDGAFERLDRARERSPLPEEPAHAAALEAWLIDLRRRRLGA